MSFRIEARSIKKVFNRRVIFQDVSFSLSEHQTLIITGKNGSGKSTLVKILSSVLTPTSGAVTISSDLPGHGHSALHDIGLVSPYLTMYDEFSAAENLHFALAMRGLRSDTAHIDSLLDRVALYNRRNDLVRTYSSGMKQRVKYAFALVHRPAILMLDEPMANLDSDGVAMVRHIMDDQRAHGILIIATNDLSDVDTYDNRVDLDERA